MLTKEILGAISVVLAVVGQSRYVWNCYKYRTRPHAFSWVIWTLVTAIAFFAQRTEDTGPGTWLLGVEWLICLSGAVMAIFRGERNITRSDWAALLGALIAIQLWYFTGKPLEAVVLVTLIDAFAFYPTIRKSWNKPQEETAFMYGLSALKFGLSLYALERVTFVTALYPSFIVLVNSGFVIALLWRRRVIARKPFS
jgi:hypothetical protein